MDMGRLGQTFFTFFGCGTGPKRSGADLACFWTDFQTKPEILDPILCRYRAGPCRAKPGHVAVSAWLWHIPKRTSAFGLLGLYMVGAPMRAPCYSLGSAGADIEMPQVQLLTSTDRSAVLLNYTSVTPTREGDVCR